MKEHFDETIEELIKSKSFEELTSSEKNLIIDQISEEKYNLYHDFLKDTTTAFTDIDRTITLSEANYKNLISALNKKHQQPKFKWAILPEFNWTNFYYQPLIVSFAIVILIVIYMTYPNQTNEKKIMEKQLTTNSVIQQETVDQQSEKPTLEDNKTTKIEIPLIKNPIVINNEKANELSAENFIKHTQLDKDILELECCLEEDDEVTNQLKTMSFTGSELTNFH